MDKIKLFTPHNAIPRHIRSEYFECTGVDHLRGGLKTYYYIDRKTGVHLTDTPNGLTIEFNPTRYTHGHNYQQIDRKGLAEVAQAIEDRYQTPFREWTVSGFDYNSNIEVEHHPEAYFTELGKLKKWNVRETDKTGVGYQTSTNSKAFTLYDLHVRCKETDTPIPPTNEGKHIIRLEVSFNKELPKVKQLRQMRTFNDYLQPENYRKLPELWLNTFEQIEKNEPVEEIPGLTTAERNMLTAIQRYTLNGYRERVKIDHPNGKHYYQFRKIDELLQKVRVYRKRNLLTRVEELTQKVQQRAQELVLAI